jgi:hypothetical protein
MRGVRDHLGQADVEPVLGADLADDDAFWRLLDNRRRRHPVLRLVAAGVGVDHHGAVRLEHEEAQGLREDGGEAAGVADLAAGDD